MLTRITSGKAKGVFVAPPSKSMAHRLLICAGLSEGESKIDNVSFSEDIEATINCLVSLGVSVKRKDNSLIIKGQKEYRINNVLKCNESGSTLRFFIPVSLAVAGGSSFTGTEKLLSRPLDEYKKICCEQGISFDRKDNELVVSGHLKAGKYEISSEVSSQFASGLLFALPLLKNDSEIVFVGKVNSKSYIDMTISALKQFGVKADWKSETSIFIRGNQKYVANNCVVEGDYSNAAFFDALNFLGSDIQIKGLNENSLQGDKVCQEFFEKMSEGYCELDISNCPDLAPILMAMGGVLNGVKLLGTSRLKAKESDRGEVMKKELGKFGITCNVFDNEIEVKKSSIHTPSELIDSHNDHRIAMAAAVLMTKTSGEIKNAQAVNKSFPSFFEELKRLGIGVESFETN